jgi:TPP-dependent pyruvate/acetoin dehydrogenase alpha subunit
VPSTSPATDAAAPAAGAAAQHYRLMRLSRRFEETAQVQFDEGQVPGPLHLSIGQEAVAVGGCTHLRDTDSVLSTHRGHHHCLAKGADPDRVLAELLGRSTGYSRGRGGSMHLSIPSIGFVGTNGIVGAGLPIATGTAYAAQVKGGDDVTVCFFGEGATGTGAFGEAINIAALWKLPLVFVCENNQYVEMTPQDVHVAGEIWRRGESFGMPGVRVDGNDVTAMAAVMGEAVERARSGGGPTLVEAVTFRWFGHYAGDRALFRTEDEVTAGRSGDPLARLRPELDPAEADRLDAEVETQIAGALAFALQSPAADAASLSLDHYASA